jgi:hypothetical protein
MKREGCAWYSSDSQLRPGTAAPATGIYVVAHREPAHAQPHEVLIPAGTILPNCYICSGTTSASKLTRRQPYEENEGFSLPKKRPSWCELLRLAQKRRL